MLLALLASGTSALAHANYVKSVPEADARLARPPTEVRVSFSEPIVARFSDVQVLDTNGARVDRGGVQTADDATLKVALGPIGDGGYVVSWHVLSAIDGHETRGSFAFALGDAPLPALPDIAESPPPGPLDIAGRALTYAGTALLLGGAFFSVAIAMRDEDRRGVAWLVRVGALGILGGTGLLLAQSGGTALLGTSRLGLLFIARAVVATAAIVTPVPLAWVAFGVLAAVSLSLQSHAAAFGDALAVGLDLAHVLAASAWVGGLVALALLALPRRRGDRDLGALVGRFSTLGVIAVGTLALTGVAQSLQRLADPLDLVETPYGLAIDAKALLLVAATGLAAFNLLRHGPRLRAGVEGTRAKRLLQLGVRGEVALVAGILIAASLLTSLAPPSTRTGAGFSGLAHSAGLRIQLLARNGTAGQDRYVVRLQEGLAGPPRDIDKVSLRFTMVEHDMGEQELVLPERAAGEYAADGSPMVMFGTWRVQVVVRREAHDEARTLFVVPAFAPTGGGKAQVLQAGTLTLVAFFLDPNAVVAGRPLQLAFVAVDPQGNPVSDARIAVSLEGTTYDATPGANGRYLVELPGLEAGDKVVTIAVTGRAGAGPAQLAFTVAP